MYKSLMDGKNVQSDKQEGLDIRDYNKFNLCVTSVLRASNIAALTVKDFNEVRIQVYRIYLCKKIILQSMYKVRKK